MKLIVLIVGLLALVGCATTAQDGGGQCDCRICTCVE